MRKVRLGMNVSLDGYIAGPHGELDWLVPAGSPTQEARDDSTAREGELVRLGRVSALRQTANGESRVGFTRPMGIRDWNDARLAAAVAAEIGRIKQQPGKDIIVTGGPSLAQSLLRLGLVDEYDLTIHPVALGHGIPLFDDLTGWLALTLVSIRPLESGAFLASYQPASQPFHTQTPAKE